MRFTNVSPMVLAAMAVLAASDNLAVAEITIVDQQNQFYQGALGYGAWDPLGQEFTPTLSSLDVVQLRLTPDSTATGGTSYSVNIRDGQITGAILGSSGPVVVPYGSPLYTLTEFDFSTPISLTPGDRYVIEVTADQYGAGIAWTGTAGSKYPGGQIITNGVPGGVPTSLTDGDLWFREGLAAPEPSTLALLATGLASLSFLARRRRKRSQ